MLGEAAVRAAWRDVEDEARRQLGAEIWRAWTSGSPAERARVADDTHRAGDDLDRKRGDGATQARAVEHLRANPCGYHLDGDGDLWSWADVTERGEEGQLMLQVRTARGVTAWLPEHRQPMPPGWYAPFGLV